MTPLSPSWCKKKKKKNIYIKCIIVLSWYMSHNMKTYLRTCAPSEHSDQHAHSCSLIRIFTGHILDSQRSLLTTKTLIWLRGCKGWFCLRLAHMSEGTVNPLYTDTRYNDKIRYNHNLNATKPSLGPIANDKLCKNIALKVQATYSLDSYVSFWQHLWKQMLSL